MREKWGVEKMRGFDEEVFLLIILFFSFYVAFHSEESISNIEMMKKVMILIRNLQI